MSDLYCPYCDHNCGDYFDDQHEQDVDYEHQCGNCEKNFIFIITYYPCFSASVADCLNGADHCYVPVIGSPQEYFKNKFRCKWCSKKITKNG